MTYIVVLFQGQNKKIEKILSTSLQEENHIPSYCIAGNLLREEIFANLAILLSEEIFAIFKFNY